MEIQKKRNKFPIGWRCDIQEELNFIDVNNKITTSKYQRRKYLTVFGREFKVYDFTFTRDSNINKNELMGFKNK